MPAGYQSAPRVGPVTNNLQVMRGVLEFLTGSSSAAHQLRISFGFLLFPMLNPDGVVLGNYRCSTAGVDLNRCYQNPDTKTSEISDFKRLVRSVFNFCSEVL